MTNSSPAHWVGEDDVVRYALWWMHLGWCVIARERVADITDIPAISVQFYPPKQEVTVKWAG